MQIVAEIRNDFLQIDEFWQSFIQGGLTKKGYATKDDEGTFLVPQIPKNYILSQQYESSYIEDCTETECDIDHNIETMNNLEESKPKAQTKQRKKQSKITTNETDEQNKLYECDLCDKKKYSR